MFSRLLKYEFKSQLGLIALLSGIVLVVGALGCGVIHLLRQLLIEKGFHGLFVSNNGVFLSDFNLDSPLTMLALLSMPASIWLVIAAAVYAVAIRILVLYRFYRRLFTDEGYLTFTLPVTTHQILLSGFVSMSVWTLLAALIALLTGGLVLSSMFSMMNVLTGMNDINMLEDIAQELQWIFMGNGDDLAIQIISIVASFLAGIIQPMVSLALGSIVAKKNKLLAGIGIYFGINMVVSAVSGIVNVIAVLGDELITYNTGNYTATLTILLPALVSLAFAIGGYFLTHYLLDKKLNLP